MLATVSQDAASGFMSPQMTRLRLFCLVPEQTDEKLPDCLNTACDAQKTHSSFHLYLISTSLGRCVWFDELVETKGIDA